MNPNLLLVVLLVIVVRVLGLHSYSISSDSMLPTVGAGDYVMARYYQSGDMPRRGDLMTFHNPQVGSGGEWVKRVIGLPGDRVQLRASRVYVNGVALEQEHAGTDGSLDVFIETTPEGRHYRIVKGKSQRVRDDTPEVVVPSGHYYVLGDNRDNSADSRDKIVGLVSRENVVARMYFVFWGRSKDRLGTWLE